MLDIVEAVDGADLGMALSIVPKAANVLSIQLGTLEYIPTFGVDLKFFLESPFEFQNDSFKVYLIQRLTEHQINVAGVVSTIETLIQRLRFSVGDANQDKKGLIA